MKIYKIQQESFRIALAISLSILAYQYLKIERGYWCILTVFILYSVPITGLAMRRAKDRLLGTVLGIIAAYFYTHFVLYYDYRFVYVCVFTMLPAFFYIKIQDYYMHGAFFITFTIIIFLTVSTPLNANLNQLMAERLVYTGLGILIVAGCEIFIFPKASQIGSEIDELRHQFSRIYGILIKQSTAMLVNGHYDAEHFYPHYERFIKNYCQIREMYHAQVHELRYNQDKNRQYDSFFKLVDELIPLTSSHLSLARHFDDHPIQAVDRELLLHAEDAIVQAIEQTINKQDHPYTPPPSALKLENNTSSMHTQLIINNHIAILKAIETKEYTR